MHWVRDNVKTWCVATVENAQTKGSEHRVMSKTKRAGYTTKYIHNPSVTKSLRQADDTSGRGPTFPPRRAPGELWEVGAPSLPSWISLVAGPEENALEEVCAGTIITRRRPIVFVTVLEQRARDIGHRVVTGCQPRPAPADPADIGPAAPCGNAARQTCVSQTLTKLGSHTH